MTEKLSINNKDVWIKIDTVNMHRDNPDVIPTEYFMATYYTHQPVNDESNGYIIKNEDDKPKLFESPVAALSYTEKVLEKML